MKSLIAVAVAAAFALPAFAQQQNLPSAQERAENREKVQQKTDKMQEKLPSAEERAGNRREVSKSAAGTALTSKVKAALAREEGMKTLSKINVDSADGVVTLKGKVESAEAKKKAEQVAKQVDGVKRVKNQLTVDKKG
jgi:hyperosmotically inducible periplasmic protein